MRSELYSQKFGKPNIFYKFFMKYVGELLKAAERNIGLRGKFPGGPSRESTPSPNKSYIFTSFNVSKILYKSTHVKRNFGIRSKNSIARMISEHEPTGPEPSGH